MRLHSDVALDALHSLVHLGARLATSIRGRTQCANLVEATAAPLYRRSPWRPRGVDGGHDLQAQVVSFQHMAKTKDGARVSQAVFTGV